MKIGILIPGFSASERDSAIPVQLHLAKRLAQRAEVHVFPIRYPHQRDPYIVHRARVHPQGGANTRGVARVPLLWQTTQAVLTEHTRAPFDVLHAMWADEPGFVAVTVGRLARVPVVISILGGELVGLRDIGYGGQLSILNRAFVRLALRGAARVLAGSTYLRLLAAPFVSQERLITLTLGVETNLFNSEQAEYPPTLKGKIRLLHTAALVPIKDQVTLLHAFARVAPHFSDVHLHMIGDGPLLPTLQQLATDLEISTYLTFHGAVLHEKMPLYYQNVDLCLMASRHEGQELATLEAAACGVTTVGTAVGILPDIVPPEQIAPVGDVEALATAILSALSNPAQTRAIAKRLGDQVRERYSLARCVQDLEQVYTTVSLG